MNKEIGSSINKKKSVYSEQPIPHSEIINELSRIETDSVKSECLNLGVRENQVNLSEAPSLINALNDFEHQKLQNDNDFLEHYKRHYFKVL